MSTEASQSTNSNNYVFDPPNLPAHLSSIYALKPIVGDPNDEDVKEIHAAIRAVNAEAQIPHLFNPDLSLQLSQYLFNVQLVICRKAYPISLFSGEYTYTPPTLPAHIPVPLEPVVGTATRDQLKAVQSAIRVAESLGFTQGPLFDPDLNMDLSQHLFNLQFARYIQGSTLGQFTPKSQESRQDSHNSQASHAHSSVTRNTSADLPEEDLDIIEPEPAQSNTPETRCTRRSEPNQLEVLESCLSSKITQQGVDINAIRELMSESKGVLENMNRVLIAMQRGQIEVGQWGARHRARVNPVNKQGITAVEYGLPRLHYYYNERFWSYDGVPRLNDTQLISYLKFFDVGADLTEGDQEPQIKDGKRDEAEDLIYKQIGVFP